MTVYDDIKLIIEECENVQNSNESDYTKQCAIVNAYKDIADVIKQEKTCKTCKWCLKLYVPPVKMYDDIPKDSYVCGLFIRESGDVQYLGDDSGMCEVYSPKVGDVDAFT